MLKYGVFCTRWLCTSIPCFERQGISNSLFKNCLSATALIYLSCSGISDIPTTNRRVIYCSMFEEICLIRSIELVGVNYISKNVAKSQMIVRSTLPNITSRVADLQLICDNRTVNIELLVGNISNLIRSLKEVN